MYRSNPVWPEFLELVTPVPVREASRETGPLTIELERLVRVPALLFRLFLEADVLPKEGSGDLEREPEGEVEVPLFKSQRKKKSHRWLFNAFGAILEPNVCVLLDAGTKPSQRVSIIFAKLLYHLGSPCGEIQTPTSEHGYVERLQGGAEIWE